MTHTVYVRTDLKQPSGKGALFMLNNFFVFTYPNKMVFFSPFDRLNVLTSTTTQETTSNV